MAGLGHAASGTRRKGRRVREPPESPCDPRCHSDCRGVLRVLGIGGLDRALLPVQREHAEAHVNQLDQ
jgi:hypothetical protein